MKTIILVISSLSLVAPPKADLECHEIKVVSVAKVQSDAVVMPLIEITPLPISEDTYDEMDAVVILGVPLMTSLGFKSLHLPDT